jgi:hypothetical protein
MSDQALPATFTSAPANFQNTLRRSHVVFEKGWPGITFEDYLIKILEHDGTLSVVRDVFNRVQGVYPTIWDYIDVLYFPWTYPMGSQVSEGFTFDCSKPDDLLTMMRFACVPGRKFCEDWMSVHGPRDCFREIITATGPGLHVCVTQPAARGKTRHEIHIDQFQMVCLVRDGGSCNYQHLSSADHYKQAIPWVVKEKIVKPLGQAIVDLGTQI